MNYEEKYKDALKRAEAVIKIAQNQKEVYGCITTIFPELKESEDEKVRKALIRFHKSTIDVDGIKGEDIITWLEKQAEQKETLCDECKKEQPSHSCQDITALGRCAIEKQGEQEKPQVYKTKDGEMITYSENDGYKVVEPKFHEGDYIVDDCDHVWKIELILNQFYVLEDVEGDLSQPTIEWVDKTFHLWTIQDAKPGDVLASELCYSIILFKGVENNNIQFYCDYDFSEIDVPGDRFSINNGQHYGNVDDSKDFHPATKEQRDLLFSKMHEAGYEWDEEKKELRKIEDDSKNCKQQIMSEITSLVTDYIKQKPVWSKEDERNLKGIIDEIEANKNNAPDYDLTTYDRFLSWLKSLKERIGG